MDLVGLITRRLGWVPPRLRARLEKRLRQVPAVRKQIRSETTQVLDGLEETLKPYRDQVRSFDRIPEEGVGHEEILAELRSLQAREQSRWQEGLVSGAVYHGDPEHVEFLNRVYAIHSQSNPLHADLWPSATKFEAEVVAMTAWTLGARQAGAAADVCGVLTSGGTESILMAMKAYLDLTYEV